MSRRRRQGLSPSLFPFLAVLVCTLGTLILLLALVAQNATDAAEQNARAERLAQQQTEEPAPDYPQRLTAEAVEELLDEERFRVAQLVAFRDEQTADLEERRDQLTHVEDHLARLRKRLKQLNNEVGLATGDTKAEQEIDQQMLITLQKQLEAEKKAVEELKAESKNKAPKVVIVPHKGPNGTDRRPVYLECDSTGVTILPEASKITMEQLESSSYSANPLDAALRVIRMHAMREYGDPVPPYPLLVVRPDGIDAYAAARRAMRDWDDQFGYELVPDHVELAFAKPDPGLKARVDFAIREAAAHQSALEMVARGGGRGGGGSFAPGRVSGTRRLPTLSAASLDRDGRANGFRSHRDNAYAGQQWNRGPYVGSTPYTRQSGASNFSQQDAGAAARDWAAKMQSAAEEMRAANNDSSGNQGSQTRGSTMQGAGLSNPAGQGLLDPQGSQADAMKSITGGIPSYAPHPNQSNLGYNAANGQYRQNPYAAGATQKQSSRTDELRPGSAAFDGRHSGNEQRSAQPSSGGLEMPPQGRGGTGKRSQFAEQGVLSEAEQDRGAGTATNQATQAQTVGTGGTQSSGRESSQPSAASSTNQIADQQPQSGAPAISADMSPRPQLRRGGKDWAIPKSIAGIHGNSIVRTIRVECYSDRFVLLAPGSGGATEVFGFSNGDVERATMQLASAVHDRIERWGPALPGGRWEPRMDVMVKPRGDVRFHQLRTLMRDSGVEVVGRSAR